MFVDLLMWLLILVYCEFGCLNGGNILEFSFYSMENGGECV